MALPSASTAESMMRASTDKAPVMIFKITPDPLDATINDALWTAGTLRFADHPTDITHDDGGGSELYAGVPIQIDMPDSSNEEVPRIKITVMGIGETYTELFRTVNRQAICVASLVTIDTSTGTTQDTADRIWPQMRLVNVTGTVSITFHFEKRSFLDSPHPIRRYDIENFPGLG